jgi:hypothetical protein
MTGVAWPFFNLLKWTRFEVPSAVEKSLVIYWVMTPCRPQRCNILPSSAELNTETVCSHGTLLRTYPRVSNRHWRWGLSVDTAMQSYRNIRLPFHCLQYVKINVDGVSLQSLYECNTSQALFITLNWKCWDVCWLKEQLVMCTAFPKAWYYQWNMMEAKQGPGLSVLNLFRYSVREEYLLHALPFQVSAKTKQALQYANKCQITVCQQQTETHRQPSTQRSDAPVRVFSCCTSRGINILNINLPVLIFCK